MSDEQELTMYIIVNNDLNMQKGKLVSQACHVAGEITEILVRSGYESTKLPDSYQRYVVWKMTGCKKIVLKATEQQILDLMQEGECVSIRDAGRTQVAPNSLTAIGFYPSAHMSDKVKHLKLL